jgi:hypothetical protein
MVTQDRIGIFEEASDVLEKVESALLLMQGGVRAWSNFTVLAWIGVGLSDADQVKLCCRFTPVLESIAKAAAKASNAAVKLRDQRSKLIRELEEASR